MIDLHKLLRIAVILLTVVLIAQVKSGEMPSWADPGQDIERQTVPTRTSTPEPGTATPKSATPKPSTATPKSGTPQPSTATPKPGTPAPSSSTDNPTPSPTDNLTSPMPDATLTVDTTLTAIATEPSEAESNAGPLTLPQAGGPPNLLIWVEAFILAIGVLLLLTGSRADRHQR